MLESDFMRLALAAGAIVGAERAERPPDREATRPDDLANGDRRRGGELGPLRDVADPRETTRSGWRAEQPHAPGRRALETERETQERRLPAPVGPGDPEERPLLDP